MSKPYAYVGASHLLELLQNPTPRFLIRTFADIEAWVVTTEIQVDKTVVATFIVDLAEQLWVADRRSEHVVCARGEPVLSAGEIEFSIGRQPEIIMITNQSTGYCPEPSSWEVVGRVLAKIDISHPPMFTTVFEFRRCESCQATNIIKDNWYFCGVCDTVLPQEWNFAKGY